MDVQSIALAAGSMSALLFMSANIPMLVKAYKTKNLRSYSLSNIVLINVGNVLYWFYISNLPPGPIWLLHSFYTVASALMLLWYMRYEGFSAARLMSAFSSARTAEGDGDSRTSTSEYPKYTPPTSL